MPQLTDPSYLKNFQYRDSSNLTARAALHEKYSTNPVGWHQWVFQQLDLSPQSRILEIGSGPAYLWQVNLTQINPELRINLSDISSGMLEESRAALRGLSQFSYSVLDGTDLPFPSGVFDAVIANHMLYHLRDIPSAIKEIYRVLKAGSCLYAATNGAAHLQEILEWEKAFLPDTFINNWGTAPSRFGLETGPDLLGVLFPAVQIRRYPDQLTVTEAEPILAYLDSYSDLPDLPQIRQRLQAYLESILADEGKITISKDSGLLLAAKR